MPEQRFKLKIEDLKKGSDSLKDNLAYFDLLYGFSCISGMSVRKKEDIHSKILAIFLSYGKDGYAALKSFLKTISSSDVRFTELNVRNPNIGFNDNFVDISIKDEQYYIIIENKIKGAKDGPSQLARYIEGAVHGAHYDQKDVYLIYLTLDNSTDVSKQSWRRCNNGKKTDYENDFRGRYKHVTYRDHILPWLKNDLKRIVGDDRNLIGFVDIYIKCIEGTENEEAILKYINDNRGSWQEAMLEMYDSQDYSVIHDCEYIKNSLYQFSACLKEKILDIKFKEWSNKLESGEYKNFVHTNVDCDYPKFGVAFEWMPDNGVPRVFYCMVERHVMPVQLYYGLYKFDTIDDIDKFFFKKLMSVLENEDSYADRYRFITQNPKQYFYYKKFIEIYSYSERELDMIFDYFIMDMIKRLSELKGISLHSLK